VRVVVVVNDPVFGKPLSALLRQGGVEQIVAVVHDDSDLAAVVNSRAADLVFVGARAVGVYEKACERFDPAAFLTLRRALGVTHQNNEVLRMAADLGFDGVVDLHQDRTAIHQQLRNLMLMSGEFSVLPTTPSAEQMFFAGRDATDRRIVEQVALGMTDKQIAEFIKLAPQTVRNRISKMMTDAGLNNRTHLATYWLREQSMMTRERALPSTDDNL
jgi:DNA-binding NarL/FixJ family response regulator